VTLTPGCGYGDAGCQPIAGLSALGVPVTWTPTVANSAEVLAFNKSRRDLHLPELEPGDLLFYADAAMHFVNPIDPMLKLLDRHGLDLLILGEGFVEAQYTKRDAFILMDADRTQWIWSAQRFASGFILRKSAWADDFIARYLSYAEDERILTDRPNTCGLADYPEFVAHRHDQSIFSLLSKLEQVPVVASGLIAEGLPGRGAQIINHTRGHHSPREVIERLLIQGVISVEELNAMADFPRAQPDTRA
jgi:hypothetical protein